MTLTAEASCDTLLPCDWAIVGKTSNWQALGQVGLLQGHVPRHLRRSPECGRHRSKSGRRTVCRCFGVLDDESSAALHEARRIRCGNAPGHISPFVVAGEANVQLSVGLVVGPAPTGTPFERHPGHRTLCKGELELCGLQAD